MISRWPTGGYNARNCTAAQKCRNISGLKSEAGCGGVITFKYNDGLVINVKGDVVEVVSDE